MRQCLALERQKALRALAAKGFLKDVGSALPQPLTLKALYG
jgi:hypothetical protein